MWVDLSDGRTIGVPLTWFPRLLNATPAQREQVERSRTGLHWEEIDEDISISGLLAPARPDDPAAMGGRLRRLRIAYGKVQGYTREMRQVEIARIAGVSQQAWNNFEAGRGRIGIDNAMRISRVTGASLDYIYLGDGRLMPAPLAAEVAKLERFDQQQAAPKARRASSPS